LTDYYKTECNASSNLGLYTYINIYIQGAAEITPTLCIYCPLNVGVISAESCIYSSTLERVKFYLYLFTSEFSKYVFCKFIYLPNRISFQIRLTYLFSSLFFHFIVCNVLLQENLWRLWCLYDSKSVYDVSTYRTVYDVSTCRTVYDVSTYRTVCQCKLCVKPYLSLEVGKVKFSFWIFQHLFSI
jgi:hypothetical protein